MSPWEEPLALDKTYFVDNRNAEASDDGPGSEARPFRTIGAAARILAAGERVVVLGGTYRERVAPARGGDGPSRMVSYEAAPGAEVVVKGSVLVPRGRFRRSEHWRFDPRDSGAAPVPVWELEIDPAWIASGYNPFALVNILTDRAWLDVSKPSIEKYLLRRGMVFVRGVPLRQVNLPTALAAHPEGAFWVEQHGLAIHVRFPNDEPPDQLDVEITTEEQVFAPRERGLGYIRVKGIRFEHCGNGFPPAQRGLVSVMRGHHFIVEDCDIGLANAVGLDVGLEDWHAAPPAGDFGGHVVRRCRIHDCGVCGIAGYVARGLLIEDNLVERVGLSDVELMYECAGIKLHEASDALVRRNVLRDLVHACGLWLDCLNVDCRITENVFARISSITGAVHFEGTHAPNEVDHNVIVDVRAEAGSVHEPHGGAIAVYAQGSDDLFVHDNLVAACRYGFYGRPVPDRIIGTRGGLCRGHRIVENVFVGCEVAAIDLVDGQSESNGNVFSRMPPGYLRMQRPEEILDLEAWQRWHGLDLSSLEAPLDVEVDASALELRVTVPEPLRPVSIGPFGAIGPGRCERSLDVRRSPSRAGAPRDRR